MTQQLSLLLMLIFHRALPSKKEMPETDGRSDLLNVASLSEIILTCAFKRLVFRDIGICRQLIIHYRVVFAHLIDSASSIEN